MPLYPAFRQGNQTRSVLSRAAAWLYCCEAFRSEARGEIYFFGESFDAFMAGEMYRYLSKAVERMAKLNVGKTAKRPYREKYKLGTACAIFTRIQDMGKAASWAPERERRLRAVKKAVENRVTLVDETITFSGTGSDAYRRGGIRRQRRFA
jgi:hypothetical protein